MEDFLYFLREYPFVAFLLIFFILRKIFGGGDNAKKKKEEEKAAKRAALKAQTTAKMEQARAANKARKEGKGGAETILEQIERQIEEATREMENSGRKSSGKKGSKGKNRKSASTEAESAAEEVRSSEMFIESTSALSRDVRESSTDYDLDDHGFAYHSATSRLSDEKPEDILWHMKKREQKPDAFDFKSANQLPADVAYHKNQRKYVSGSRIEAPQVSVREERKEPAPIVVGQLFSDNDALTRMFILQEIMGPPRGKQMRRGERS